MRRVSCKGRIYMQCDGVVFVTSLAILSSLVFDKRAATRRVNIIETLRSVNLLEV